jgi:hypothetical protein
MNLSLDIAASEATRGEMTRLSARGYTKIRHVLCQLPLGEPARPSTVGKLMTARKHRALILYLLLLTCWPWLEGRRDPLAAAVWVRALTTAKGPGWSTSTLSRAWTDLEEADLITRERRGRAMFFLPRREDARADYSPPMGAKDRWNTYFVLPDTFWLDETFAKLTFPGLAMLLIIASETSSVAKPEISLAYEWAKDRYGLSAKTAQNGIQDLLNQGLVHKREERIPAPLSPTNYTSRTYYSLIGDYGQAARAAMQGRAKSERAKRTKKVAATTKASSGSSVTSSGRNTPKAANKRTPRVTRAAVRKAGTAEATNQVPTKPAREAG